MEVAPDLVVEVLSPNDEAPNINRRVDDFLLAGTRLIWVIDPENRIAAIYRADQTGGYVREGQTLSGEDVLPGFVLNLADILPPVPQPAA
jgi:Uma2 family endonuclease